MKTFLAYILGIIVLTSPSSATEPNSPLTDISDAKTACLINDGTDLDLTDAVRDKLKEWGRWKLVQRPEDADLLLVLSRQDVTGAVSIGSASVNSYGSHASGSSVGVAAPFADEKVFFSAVDRVSGQKFVTVSSYRRHLMRPASSWLVGRMKDQIERHDKRYQSKPR